MLLFYFGVMAITQCTVGPETVKLNHASKRAVL